jgi:DNA-binding GntR family transcriptional regulator
MAGQEALTNADKAYQIIKEKIVSIQMQPGSIIREADLMKELGLGRTPIREALKRLQAENLVVSTPRRGMSVADIAITDLIQIYEIRVELEALGARLAARRITPEQLDELRDLVEEYRHADKEDKKILIDLDSHFHELIARATHNNFLCNELDLFHNLSLRIWHLALNYVQPEDLNVEAHLEILQAIEAHDARRAGETMCRHIEHFHKTIKLYL